MRSKYRPAFTVCGPLMNVSLSLIDSTWSVLKWGQRPSRPNDGAFVIPCPADCAEKPDGRPKETDGSRFCEFCPKRFGKGITLPDASFSGPCVSANALAPLVLSLATRLSAALIPA